MDELQYYYEVMQHYHELMEQSHKQETRETENESN